MTISSSTIIHHCQFVATAAHGIYRCHRCGFQTDPTRFAADRIHRRCDALHTNSLLTHVAHDHSSQLPPPLGLGDSVAAWIQPVARLLKLKECGGCARRQNWLNRQFPYRPVPVAATHSKNAVHHPTIDTAPLSPLHEQPLSLLLRFPHGFGDAIQLTTVLTHLRELRPHWSIDVAVKRGVTSALAGQCRRTWELDDPQLASAANQYHWDRVLRWSEPIECYAHTPATKAERCLKEVFGIEPQHRWCQYHIHPSPTAQARAAAYATEIGKPFALIHYQGNSSRPLKNLDERIVAKLCRELTRQGLAAVILDWDGRSQLVDGRHVLCPGSDHPLWQGLGTGDGGTLAALAAQATICYGIDSGPGHVFGAVNTPTVIVWTGHHPLHYYGLAEHVLHLVPHTHRQLLRGPQPEVGAAYFAQNYQHRIYANLAQTLLGVTAELLSRGTEESQSPTSASASLIVDGDLWVRRAYRAEDLTIVRDVYLEDCYQLGAIPHRPRYVVDIGAHIGAFAAAVRRRSRFTQVICVEPNANNLSCLTANVGHFAHIVTAAVSYEPGPHWLHSTVQPGTTNTGGSWVTSGGPSPTPHSLPTPAVTLENLKQAFGFPRIDILKLDCEGCEQSVLAQADLTGIRHIVGEYHDQRAFAAIVAARFADWRLTIIRAGEPGLFWLRPKTLSPQ